MSDTLRDETIVALSSRLKELQIEAMMLDAEDATAAAIVRSAVPLVDAALQKYASSAGVPFDPNAAQEIRVIADRIAEIGEKSRNKFAMDVLQHQSDMLHSFLTLRGVTIDSHDRWRFGSMRR